MAETVIVGLVVVVGIALWFGGMTLYNPRPVTLFVDWCGRQREIRRGPRPTGLPIEQLAADLRRLLWEHDRLVRSKAEWPRVHHLRACELALHDRAEEAAIALGLPPCPSSAWTTADLGRRLRQLAEAGLVLPETAGLGGDRL
ncbi:MAG: hypothetical protein QOI76_1334 [Frankiales bacterium]|jgi:hypothetical protein|nr:hypothetical protein [Frankiales bacterium]